MASRTTEWIRWEGGPSAARPDRGRQVEGILRKMAESFTQVNVAADFLHMRADPAGRGLDLQLTCLIKETIASIQQQVTELYLALDPDAGGPRETEH